MSRHALLFALLFLPRPVWAAEFDPRPIDAVVTKALKEFGAPGAAMVIVKDGEVVYLKGFGVREQGKPEPVTPDTVFNIASCTKAFTATAIAMLVDEGKLKWDDKVHDHLDYFRLSDGPADREVTIRDLLCHRTGMPRHDLILWGLANDDSEAMIRRWVKGQPSTSFRSTWEYTNVPFTTAGVIAGKIDKRDFAGVMQKRIFDPLGMTVSSCRRPIAASHADYATAHYYGLDKSITAQQWRDRHYLGGAGAINSSARDLGKWLQFQLAEGKHDGKQLLSARALRETHTPQIVIKLSDAAASQAKHTRFTSYGLGWLVEDYRGVTCVGHGGRSSFRTSCVMVPEKKLGVFVLCNLAPSLVVEAVSRGVLDVLLGLPAEDWVAHYKSVEAGVEANRAAAKKKRDAARKPDTKPTLALKEYVGVYEEPAYGSIEVTLEKDRLMGRWGRLVFRLEHYHYDTFTTVLVEPKDVTTFTDRDIDEWQFRLGVNGEVEGLKGLGEVFGFKGPNGEFKKQPARK